MSERVSRAAGGQRFAVSGGGRGRVGYAKVTGARLEAREDGLPWRRKSRARAAFLNAPESRDRDG
jgi:hypothetical protein